MIDLNEFEEQMQREGLAFTARQTTPAPEAPRRRRVRPTPEYRDPDRVVPRPRPPAVPVRVAEPADVGCTAPAWAPGYLEASSKADEYLKAGHRQGRCEVCQRVRWHDEPCAAAAFQPGKAPVQRQSSPT